MALPPVWGFGGGDDRHLWVLAVTTTPGPISTFAFPAESMSNNSKGYRAARKLQLQSAVCAWNTGPSGELKSIWSSTGIFPVSRTLWWLVLISVPRCFTSLFALPSRAVNPSLACYTDLTPAQMARLLLTLDFQSTVPIDYNVAVKAEAAEI